MLCEKIHRKLESRTRRLDERCHLVNYVARKVASQCALGRAKSSNVGFSSLQVIASIRDRHNYEVEVMVEAVSKVIANRANRVKVRTHTSSDPAKRTCELDSGSEAYEGTTAIE